MEEKQEEIKNFADEYPEQPTFDAEQIKFVDVLEKNIVIKNIAELTGQHGEFIVVLANVDGKDVCFNTGSSVVMPKLKRVKKDGNMPIRATIMKRISDKTKNEYYDIK